MLKVQNRILHNRNTNLSLQLAFSKLKNNLLQSSPQNISSVPLSGTEQPNIKNKALYLDYIEQVLKNKQLDMLKLQHQLTQKENNLYEQQYKKGVGQIIQQMEQINNMQKKLKSMQGKLGIRDQQYLSVYRKFQSQSAKCKNEMEEAFKKQFADLVNQRRILRSKLSQFAQLQSYEKYLNQLHDALQAKSQQLAERESILSQQQTQIQIQHQNQQDFESNKMTLQSNTSNRKRIKIFNTKPHYITTEQSNIQNSNQLIQFNNNQTFAKQNSYQNYRSSPYQNYNNYISNINDSSAILAQNSKDDLEYYDKFNDSKELKKVKFDIKYIEQEKSDVKTMDNSVQVDSQSINDTQQRLRKQALILKFAKKWMKKSFDSQSTPLTRKKILAVNLWKMNTCYDQGISTRAVESIQVLQKVWRKQQKILYSSKMFPYNELSIKRKKYVELMFDLQQKVTHRKKIQSLLKSILTHRHRKQRLVFYYYFCRFMKNSFNQNKVQRIIINDRNKLGLTIGTQAGTGGAHSQIISTLSSQVLHQDRINLPNKKSTASLSHNSQKSQPLSKQASNQKLGKQNIEQKKKNEQQNKKMKETIAEKQRTQRLLATQCVKLEGLIKICVILTGSCFRTNNFALSKIKQTQYNDKLKALSTQLKGLQFKFQIVMAKCKLGLANNSNKLSTLQNLLDFTNLIK